MTPPDPSNYVSLYLEGNSNEPLNEAFSYLGGSFNRSGVLTAGSYNLYAAVSSFVTGRSEGYASQVPMGWAGAAQVDLQLGGAFASAYGTLRSSIRTSSAPTGILDNREQEITYNVVGSYPLAYETQYRPTFDARGSAQADFTATRWRTQLAIGHTATNGLNGAASNTIFQSFLSFELATDTPYTLTASIDAPGSSQDNPIYPRADGETVPDEQGGVRFRAPVRGPTRGWFDPPAASGFDYDMTGGSLFTGILNFPTGFDSPFTVVVDGVVIGQFSPGQSVRFADYSGLLGSSLINGGVDHFGIRGISPLVDGSSPVAFPIQLEFNTPEADFTMTSIPEPAALTPLFALACLSLRRRAHRGIVCGGRWKASDGASANCHD